MLGFVVYLLLKLLDLALWWVAMRVSHAAPSRACMKIQAWHQAPCLPSRVAVLRLCWFGKYSLSNIPIWSTSTRHKSKKPNIMRSGWNGGSSDAAVPTRRGVACSVAPYPSSISCADIQSRHLCRQDSAFELSGEGICFYAVLLLGRMYSISWSSQPYVFIRGPSESCRSLFESPGIVFSENHCHWSEFQSNLREPLRVGLQRHTNSPGTELSDFPFSNMLSETLWLGT